MPALRARASDFLRQPAIARSLPMLGLFGVVAAAGLAWMALRQPPQRDLFRGLPDGDKAAVTEALGKTGIPYHFDSDGTLTVSQDDYFKAKMQLASEGLPKSAPDGESMIDSMPMGASRAVEGEKLRSAREMDLARTIEAIDAVRSARVHLAVEQPSVFLRDRVKPGASVMLRLNDGRSLSDAQVQAIVHLVASSVPELQPENVSVVDQNGRLLSNSQSDGGVNDRQLQLQAQMEDRYRQSIVALLTPILGAGKFSTEVHAELNFNERSATRETYPQDEARLVSEQGSWQADGKDKEAGGMPGAIAPNAPGAATASATPPAAIVPPQAGAASADGSSTAVPGTPGNPPMKTAETFNRNFELGREVSVTREAVGTMRRLSVAVALDNAPGGKPRSVQEIAALEALVKGAVGFDQARGDVVTLSARKFVPTEEAVAPWYEAGWVSMLVRNVSALLVVIVLLLGIGRPLLKRRAQDKQAAVADQSAMRQRLGQEISAELSRAAATPQAGATVTLDMISSTHGYADRATLIRNFVKQDPDRAALVVRDLLKEGQG